MLPAAAGWSDPVRVADERGPWIADLDSGTATFGGAGHVAAHREERPYAWSLPLPIEVELAIDAVLSRALLTSAHVDPRD